MQFTLEAKFQYNVQAYSRYLFWNHKLIWIERRLDFLMALKDSLNDTAND